MFSRVALALPLLLCMPFCRGDTYEQDVYAINGLYVKLGSPPLPGWSALGGDPCGEGWQGVQCVNSNITAIVLNGADLGGELCEELVNFTSLITIDLSNNRIGGSIPDSLPVTIREFFLSANQLTGSIPDSLSELTLLSDMSLNDNLLSGELPDAFQDLSGLINFDISHNNFTGQLPPSMKSLFSLTSLHVQNNQLSGTLDVLQNLPLLDLNVENNVFSGPIPEKILNIPNFKKGGNPFNTSIAPSPLPPPPTTWPFSQSPAPATLPPKPTNGSDEDGVPLFKNYKFSTLKLIGFVAAGVVLLAIIILMAKYILKWQKKKFNREETHNWKDVRGHVTMEEPQTSTEFIKQHKGKSAIREPIQKQEYNFNVQGAMKLPVPPKMDKHTAPKGENTLRDQTKILNFPTSTRSFRVVSLQQYTNSFSQDNLIHNGRFGRLYLAEFPQGKLFAVLKLDDRNLNLPEDDFLKLVKSISEIKHPNVVELVGYSVDYGQRLLVYNYFSYRTLSDVLHSNDDLKKSLSWNDRIQIALGTAKALEYLHEVCQPPIVHQRIDSSCILIGDDLSIRVSECGLASVLPSFSDTQLSDWAPSSYSYGAPEFTECGLYSEHSDVYSFGIVMLELLTGRKPFDWSLPWAEQHLGRWASSQLHDINALIKMMDPSVCGQFSVKLLSRFADIISRCIQQGPEFRPPMSEVIADLARVV